MFETTPAERRQLTVLFCDLVGSTTLAERLDSEEWRELIDEYHALAERVLTRHGGFIGQFLGDGVLAYFGWPQALESAAAQAVQGGLALLEAVAARNAARARGGPTFQIRLAVHTGPVIVGELGTGERRGRVEIVGHTSNLAARLPYLFATCRFAHYLKCMVRDKIGSFKEREDMEMWLNKWISQYTCDSKADEFMKAKYPLAAAQVEVKEVAGNPGYYTSKFFLRPHYQLEGLTVSLRLVSKLPSAKGGG